MNTPENLKYTKEHEWISVEGNVAKIGITDHAQAELTDIVFVELPQNGKQVETGDPVAVVESVKAASDIYAPIDGKIVEGNADLETDPSLVNTSPYEKGWIYKIEISNSSQVEALMTSEDYNSFVG